MTRLPITDNVDICLTNSDFGLDGRDDDNIGVVRSCFRDNRADRNNIWLSGYCLFRICNLGMALYKHVGCSNNPILDDVNKNTNPKGQLMIIGVDLI